MRSVNLLDDRPLLGLAMREDQVGSIDAHHGPVRRNDDDLEPVGLPQLAAASLRGASHAAQPRITPQEPLERHRSENAPVGPPVKPLLGFERGLQAIGPVTIRHDTAGELVDDFDAAVPDDVVDVAAKEDARVERAVESVSTAMFSALCRPPHPRERSTCSKPASVSSTSRPYSSLSKWTPGVSEVTSAASRGVSDRHDRRCRRSRVEPAPRRSSASRLRPPGRSETADAPDRLQPSPADREGGRIRLPSRSRR